jgi:acetolactate synthase-1/2/3 large subunit
MNGADALIETFIDNDVAACFANPGASATQFVCNVTCIRRRLP